MPTLILPSNGTWQRPLGLRPWIPSSIADKVTRSKTLPHNLQQCFEKALEYKASFQLSKGVNMAQKTTIMNVNVEEEDEVNFVKDARARSNACFKCGKMGHFQHDCQYNGDKPSDSQMQGQTALDSYESSSRKVDDQFGGHYSYHSKSHAKSDNRTQ